VEDEPILSRSDLEHYERQLSLLSDAGVEKEYQRCWEGSRFDGKQVPPAAVVQGLVERDEHCDGSTGGDESLLCSTPQESRNNAATDTKSSSKSSK
jgi:hypothetical protein